MAPVPGSPDLAEIQARLEAILDPYRDRLEPSTIYGIPTLLRPGASAHDWFAFVKPASRHVSLFLLPVVTWPDLLDGCPPVLMAHHAGTSTFTFRRMDEPAVAALEALVARAFNRYMSAG